MGRYTGPVEKLSRREGVQLYLKGERWPPARARSSGGRTRPGSTAGRANASRRTASSCRVERLPERDEIDIPANPQLIVELYSK